LLSANHAHDQVLLDVFAHNDCDKHYIVDTTRLDMVETKEEEMKTDAISPETVQFNLIETSIEDKCKADANCNETSQFAVGEICGKEEMKTDIIRTEAYQLNTIGEGGKTDVACTEISQFDGLKIADNKKTKTPFSTNSYGRDLSSVNKQENDYSNLRLKVSTRLSFLFSMT
jgi:hypothetical protein